MSNRLAGLALGVAIAVAPSVHAQGSKTIPPSPQEKLNPTSPTTGENTTGTSVTGATAPGQKSQSVPNGDGQAAQGVPARNGATTGSSAANGDRSGSAAGQAGAATDPNDVTSGKKTMPEQRRPTSGTPTTMGSQDATSSGSGTVASQPMTQPAATHSGSTPMAADQSGATVRRAMPETAAGWLGMLLGGSTLSGLGLAARRFRR